MIKNSTTPWLRPGVKALIVNQGKILMVKERIEGRIIYDFPGGGVDYGEDLKKALKREVSEEIGLEIIIGKAVGNWSFILEKHKVQIVCMGYQCKLNGSDKINMTNNPAEEDIFDAIWFTKEEILADADNLLRAEGMREAVENLVI